MIIASFGAYDEADLETYSPVVVHVDAGNRPARVDSNPEVLLSEFAPSWGPDEVPGAFTGGADVPGSFTSADDGGGLA